MRVTRRWREVFSFCALATLPAWAATPRDFSLEYRKNDRGVYTAVLINRHAAAVTAYLAEVAFDSDTRERHSALGGDTLGFTNGEESEIGPGQQDDTGRPLPPGSVPVATRVLAVICADGVTEGDDEDVAMLLAGRRRAYEDLHDAIPLLEKAASGSLGRDALISHFDDAQKKDQSEGAELDDMQDAPGRMRYRFFLNAVPVRALNLLNGGASPSDLLNQFRGWFARLAASKPALH